MVNSDAAATTAEECLAQCNANSGCKFWDFSDDNTCRLRSNEGINSLVQTVGSSYGPKNCIFSKYMLI